MKRTFTRCKGIATNQSTGGDPKPCGNWALKDSEYCLHHDPAKPPPPRKKKTKPRKPPSPYVGHGTCKFEGKPCGNPAGQDGYCWSHKPEQQNAQ